MNGCGVAAAVAWHDEGMYTFNKNNTHTLIIFIYYGYYYLWLLLLLHGHWHGHSRGRLLHFDVAFQADIDIDF